MEHETERGKAIVEVIKSDSVVDLNKEYAEIVLDSALESGAFKDLPVVNTIFGIFSAVGSVRDELLVSKLIRFINGLSAVPEKERIEMMERLNDDTNFSGRAGTAVIEVLDRMESHSKPELAAKCFVSFAKEEISAEELRRILFALERTPSFDIEKLKSFSEATIEESVQMDESMLLAFVNAGLGKNNGGLDGGAIIPTSLCKTFVKVCIDAA